MSAIHAGYTDQQENLILEPAPEAAKQICWEASPELLLPTEMTLDHPLT